MKAKISVISGLLGIALMAMPMTAAAHPRNAGGNRWSAPAYRPGPAFRQAPAFRAESRANFAPRPAMRPAFFQPMPRANVNAGANWNRPAFAPPAFVPVRHD